MVGRRVLLVGVALLCLLVLADVVGADAVYKKRRKAKDPANGDVKKQKKNANGILDVNQNVISDTKEGFNHVRKRELDSDADQKMIQEQLENAAKEGRERYQRNVKRLQREEDGKRNRMKKKQNGWKKHHQNFRSEQREKKAQLKQKLKDRVSEHDRDLSKYELSQQKLRRAAKTEAELKKAARLAHLMAIKKQRDQAAAASTGRSREMARKQHAIDRARDKEAIDRDVRDERRQKKRHALYKRSFKKEQAERDTKFKAWKIRERKRKNAREARLKQKEKTYKKHQKERARKLRKDN